MKVAFLTTQTIQGSTVIGRVMPLATQLSREAEVHVLVHQGSTEKPDKKHLHIHQVGRDPFERTENGKKRLKGMALILRMKMNALLAILKLWRIRPDVLVIVKSLPENVFAAFWYQLLRKPKIILDVDDFELTANALTSPLQRAAVHWAERWGVKMAHHVVAASPFLQDHFHQLRPNVPTSLIPTGIDASVFPAPSKRSVQRPRLLYLGSVSRSTGQRVDLLPEILEYVHKQIPQAQLEIAGTGDDVGHLKEEFKARELTQYVTWSGRFALPDVPEKISGVAVLIDPVDANIENRAKSSSRILFGAYFGVPTVTSNVGIRPELIPQALQARMFAKPGDPHSYAEHIIGLLAQPLEDNEQDDLHAHGLRFNWKTLAQEYKQVIQNV